MSPSNERESSKVDSDIDEMKFEDALAELEAVVEKMEEGRLLLDESIGAYRRGNALLRHCQALLSDAERKVRIFENGDLRDFESETEAGAEK
jgi:exodeoxyribonuclease VII small subunit